MATFGHPPLADCWAAISSMEYVADGNPEAIYHSNNMVVDLPGEHIYKVPRLYSFG